VVEQWKKLHNVEGKGAGSEVFDLSYTNEMDES